MHHPGRARARGREIRGRGKRARARLAVHVGHFDIVRVCYPLWWYMETRSFGALCARIGELCRAQRVWLRARWLFAIHNSLPPTSLSNGHYYSYIRYHVCSWKPTRAQTHIRRGYPPRAGGTVAGKREYRRGKRHGEDRK